MRSSWAACSRRAWAKTRPGKQLCKQEPSPVHQQLLKKIYFGRAEQLRRQGHDRDAQTVLGNLVPLLEGDPAALEKEERSDGHEVGEVLARGPNIFAGYRNLDKKTAEIFTDDRWFRTGDMGYFDDRGQLHLLGRISTLIKTESGEKIQTEDVEAAYAETSAIREIGVLEKKGKLVALVVPKHAGGGGDDAKDAVRKAIEAASKHLPSHQRISDYAITSDALPRTRLGKIQRHRLVERYWPD